MSIDAATSQAAEPDFEYSPGVYRNRVFSVLPRSDTQHLASQYALWKENSERLAVLETIEAHRGKFRRVCASVFKKSEGKERESLRHSLHVAETLTYDQQLDDYLQRGLFDQQYVDHQRSLASARFLQSTLASRNRDIETAIQNAGFTLEAATALFDEFHRLDQRCYVISAKRSSTMTEEELRLNQEELDAAVKESYEYLMEIEKIILVPMSKELMKMGYTHSETITRNF